MKNYQFRLIDNTYAVDEAYEILMAIVSSKINFLNLKVFSLQEKYGADTTHLEKRIEELKAEKRTLQLLLSEYDGEELEIDLSCALSLQLVEPIKS